MSHDPSTATVDHNSSPGVLTLVRPVRGYRPWVLGLTYWLILLPMTIVPRHSGNVMSRYMTIEAIVERGTLEVERTPMMAITRPVDMVRFGNHFYSDKPPVLAVLAAPIYGMAFLLGVRFMGSEEQFLIDNLAITWLTAGLCSAMTLVWLRRLLQALPLSPWVADLLTLGYGLGTPILTYAVTFNNHSVAASLITGAMTMTLLERPEAKLGANRFGIGLLLGLAAVIDLPTGCLMLAGLGLLLMVRSRAIPWAFVLGSLGPLLLHAWLQSKVTGSPLPVEMYPESFNYPGSFWLKPEGTFHEYGPRYGFGLEMLVGPPGWLTLTPALAFGVVGLVMAIVRRGDTLRSMALMVAGTWVILMAYYTWVVRRTDFAGQSFGTRHLLAISPAFYVFGVVALSRLRSRLAWLTFVLFMGVGFFYAFQGMKDPWSRVEERALKSPSIEAAQRFVLYPWSRTRHQIELDRQKALNAPQIRSRPKP